MRVTFPLLFALALQFIAAPYSHAISMSETNTAASAEMRPWRLKFGRNDDIDTAAEDVWSAGGDCPWPAAAAETTVVSDSADDAAAGTGCRTAQINCLNDTLDEAFQTITMTGATPVTLGTDCRRATRAKCLTAGTAGTNAGTIDIKHGATIIGQIPAGYGQSLMACDTIPAGKVGQIAGWHCSVNRTQAGVIEFSLDRRDPGGAWTVMETFDINSQGAGMFNHDWSGYQALAAGTNIRARSRSASANNMAASCGFDIMLNPAPQ